MFILILIYKISIIAEINCKVSQKITSFVYATADIAVRAVDTA